MSHFSPMGEFLSQYGESQLFGSSVIGTPEGRGEDDWIASTVASEDHENSQQSPLNGSAFLPFEVWEEDGEYPDTYLRYTLEWKFVVKTRSILTVTEQALPVSPSSFWVNVLQSKLEEFVRKKRAAHKVYEPESTKAVLSVTERKVRDVKKHFEQLNIDGPSLERQLENWSTFFRSGKELRLDLTFNYCTTKWTPPRKHALLNLPEGKCRVLPDGCLMRRIARLMLKSIAWAVLPRGVMSTVCYVARGTLANPASGVCMIWMILTSITLSVNIT